MPLLKSKTTRRDAEYRAFLLDYAESGVFAPRSAEVRIIRLVANHGLSRLDYVQSQIWYESVLPVLSKPMSEQLLISAIKRNGGRVPRRVNGDQVADDLHPFHLERDVPGLHAEPGDATSSRILMQIAKALRAGSQALGDGADAPPASGNASG